MCTEDKRFVLRLPAELHGELVEIAEADSRSLHNLIILILKREVARSQRVLGGEMPQNGQRRVGALAPVE